MMRIEDVELVKITVSPKRRPISKATVNAIAGSILNVGLQNPIGLTEDYRLIHGRHRLEAYRQLGWDKIPASIHDVDDVHAALAEIDENIQRKQLTAAEECKALARRKELYLTLHPETKRGGAPGKKGGGKKPKQTKSVSFVSDTSYNRFKL
jgi:ParB family chromosome partitioning protein